MSVRDDLHPVSVVHRVVRDQKHFRRDEDKDRRGTKGDPKNGLESGMCRRRRRQRGSSRDPPRRRNDVTRCVASSKRLYVPLRFSHPHQRTAVINGRQSVRLNFVCIHGFELRIRRTREDKTRHQITTSHDPGVLPLSNGADSPGLPGHAGRSGSPQSLISA